MHKHQVQTVFPQWSYLLQLSIIFHHLMEACPPIHLCSLPSNLECYSLLGITLIIEHPIEATQVSYSLYLRMILWCDFNGKNGVLFEPQTRFSFAAYHHIIFQCTLNGAGPMFVSPLSMSNILLSTFRISLPLRLMYMSCCKLPLWSIYRFHQCDFKN